MGFADKLRSTINKVSDTAQAAGDPLPDETSRKYYEIAYGLLSSVCHTECDRDLLLMKEVEKTTYDIVPFDAVKKYIEYHLNQPCDENKLLSILDNFFNQGYNNRTYKRYVGGTEGDAFIRSNLASKNFLF